MCGIKKVRQTGFEPVTVRLEGGCSIQLSYWRKKLKHNCNHTRGHAGNYCDY